jgi:copper homeostasis protein
MLAKKNVSLEISVDSAESATAAERGGADRVELCADVLEGGVTPSAGMMAVVREAVAIPVHMMIRPRGGDFLYTREEFEAMKRDIDVAKETRAEGVVLGILRSGGNVDVERTRELVARARPMSVTFHRAFDFTPDLLGALEDVIHSGADRILTSGGEAKAEEALGRIASLVQKAGGRISIIVCGGVREHNVKRILQATHAREIHVGQSGIATTILAGDRLTNARIQLGEATDPDRERSVVSNEKVRRLVEKL